MGFGPSKYMPGQIKSQPMAELYRNQNPDEEYMRMMQMMDLQAPRALQPMQTETAEAQPQSSPIQAPKDRGMFGRFQGFNPLRFDPDKGVGEGNRLYAIGAMLSGMGSGDPALTANLLEPKLQANRVRVQKRSEEQKAAEEEARRQQMLQQLNLSPEETAFAQLFPAQAGEIIGQQLKPAAAAKFGLDLQEVTDPVTGETRFVQTSEAGGVRAVEGFVPPPPAPDQRPWWAQEGGGVDPAQLANQAAGRAGGVTVNNNLPGEKGETKFQEGLGSQAATNYQTVLDQGRAAGAAIGNLDTMETLLDNIDYTGFGGDTLLLVQRAGAMLGIEIEDLPAKEAAKRLSSQMALSLKTDLPGPMSNADREFLLSIPPNLNSTAAGNDAILFILRKREERKQDMMQSLLQANPQSMEEYRDWENQYLQTTPPMFTPATQASLLKALGGTGQ
jgi:hypothetical protein